MNIIKKHWTAPKLTKFLRKEVEILNGKTPGSTEDVMAQTAS